MNLLVCWLRGFRAVLHILVGIFLAAVILLTGGVRRWRIERVMSWWSGVMLDIFNIQVRVVGRERSLRGHWPRHARAPGHGRPGRGFIEELMSRHGGHNGSSQGVMLVANHVSWLDIILVGCVEPTRFVAKSEIRHWPIAGWLANAMGTFYIRRGKGGAKPLLEKVVPHLRAGGSFIVYPEGTTTDGTSVLPFHARLFQAAVEAQCPVQPLALRFSRGADGSNIAPFIGDDDLASHMLRLLKEPALVAEVTYCAPIKSDGLDRDALALAAQAAISAIVSEPLKWQPSEVALDHTESDPETRIA